MDHPAEPEAILRDPAFVRFVEKDHHQEYIRAAVEKICNRDDIPDADKLYHCIHCADAIVSGVRIFVSYKFGAGDVADRLIRPFLTFGSEWIVDNDGWPFYAERSIDSGTAWNEEIRRRLDEAHWFLLILPDITNDRTWTAFEAGYFRRGMTSPPDKLICIYSGELDAGPMEEFKGLPATSDGIHTLFHELIASPNAVPGLPAINANVQEADLRWHAEGVATLVRPVPDVYRNYFIPFVDFKLDDGDQDVEVDSGDQGIPSGSILSCTVERSEGMDKLFGYHGRREDVRFHEILGKEGETDADAWVSHLEGAVEAAVLNRGASVGPSFWSHDGQLYRARVHSIRRYKDSHKVASAHVAFHEVLTGPIERAPRDLEVVASALRLAYALRWEVLEARVESQRDVERLEQKLSVLESEARQRGLEPVPSDDPQDLANMILVGAFAPKERQALVELYLSWTPFRSPDRKSGRLDIALAERNPAKTVQCLHEMAPLNAAFMRLGSARYAELVAKYWPQDNPGTAP